MVEDSGAIFQNLREKYFFYLKFCAKPKYQSNVKIKYRQFRHKMFFLNECARAPFWRICLSKQRSQSRRRNSCIPGSKKVAPTKESKNVKRKVQNDSIHQFVSIIIAWPYNLCLLGQYQFTQIGHKTSFNSQECSGLTINYVVTLITKPLYQTA